MKSSKVLLNIMSVVCFIYGALYVFTLVFIPIGIYCFIAGRKFSYKAEHIEDVFAISNQVFRNYVIFVSIFCFPFGLLSIIPFYMLTSNKIKVEPVQTNAESEQTQKDDSEEQENVKKESEPVMEETLAEKKEKYEKLKKFNEKGLITDEELKQAYEDIYGKKEN